MMIKTAVADRILDVVVHAPLLLADTGKVEHCVAKRNTRFAQGFLDSASSVTAWHTS